MTTEDIRIIMDHLALFAFCPSVAWVVSTWIKCAYRYEKDKEDKSK